MQSVRVLLPCVVEGAFAGLVDSLQPESLAALCGHRRVVARRTFREDGAGRRVFTAHAADEAPAQYEAAALCSNPPMDHRTVRNRE